MPNSSMQRMLPAFAGACRTPEFPAALFPHRLVFSSCIRSLPLLQVPADLRRSLAFLSLGLTAPFPAAAGSSRSRGSCVRRRASPPCCSMPASSTARSCRRRQSRWRSTRRRASQHLWTHCRQQSPTAARCTACEPAMRVCCSQSFALASLGVRICCFVDGETFFMRWGSLLEAGCVWKPHDLCRCFPNWAACWRAGDQHGHPY